ncbi:hypothetical protein SLA2020_223110 [Shorea laevis]
MAFRLAVLLLFALVGVQLSSCQVLKGKISCLDCSHHYDLSGIKVVVKCDQVKKLVMATTGDGGSFTVNLPSSHTSKQTTPNNCLARLLGGPNQLYSSKKNMISKVVKSHEHPNSYTTSSPLAVYASCPSTATCRAPKEIGSSKTIDLPIPREWGLPPTSYYTPSIPIIIGIP